MNSAAIDRRALTYNSYGVAIGTYPIGDIGTMKNWMRKTEDSTGDQYTPELNAKLDDLADSLAIMDDSAFMERIMKSRKEISQGKTIPLTQILAENGL